MKSPPTKKFFKRQAHHTRQSWISVDTHTNWPGWRRRYWKKTKKCRSRSKKIIWFNPPHCINVQTNVGKEFLLLVDKHFPKGHFLHPILNRNTVKISYRCLPNMGRRIAMHNSKTLKSASNQAPKPKATCNCQISKKADCPVPGACNQDGAIYEAQVKTDDGKVESYVGLAKNLYKYQILLNPSVATLNLKTEIFSSCRHRLSYIIGDPPD